MGKYLLFHRHHVVKLLLWIGMEGGDITMSSNVHPAAVSVAFRFSKQASLVFENQALQRCRLCDLPTA